MSDPRWKEARSLPHAFDLCVTHARTRHNRSVENIADLMALPQAWRLYKWIDEANMPARHIRGFEHACGANYVTRYLAHSGHQLLIDIPRGRRVEVTDLHALQQITNEAVGALIEFAAGHAEADDVIAATTRAMEGLAWHRANAEKHQQPELELDA
jgi:hypothetical protein